MSDSETKELIIREFVRNGYSEKDGKRTWHINNPNLLFLTPELAQGFLDLRKFPVYRSKVIEKELSLIGEASGKMKKAIKGEPFNLIDMRCADGERASKLIKSTNGNVNIRYCPIGMSPSMGKKAVQTVQSHDFKNVVGYKPEFSNFEQLVDVPAFLRNNEFQKNVILVFGSTLALFDINDFLFNISRNMFKGDLFVIGNGIRQGERLENISTYKNDAFNNWFIHLMREIGFKDKEISYDARFGKLRVECFYTVNVDKKIKNKVKDIEFKKGDEILVATIYKYYEKELKKFCKMYFSNVDVFKDSEGEYVLILCQK